MGKNPPNSQSAKPVSSSPPRPQSHPGTAGAGADKHIFPTMIAAGNGNNLYTSRVGERDDESNSAEILPDCTADEPQANPTNDVSSLTHVKLQNSWSSVQAFVAKHIASKDLDMDWNNEVAELNGLQYVGSNDLRDVALCSLHVFFKTAVETMSHEGYTEEAVIHAITHSVLCYQFDGPITKIADSARALLKSGQQFDSSIFENLDMHLHMLGFYVLGYASSLLKKYFPLFTWSDALWCILLCDMDISIARAFSIDMSAYGNEQSEGHAMNNQNVFEPSGGYVYTASKSSGGPVPSQSEKLKRCRAVLSISPERTWSNVLTNYIPILRSAGKDEVASSGQIQKSAGKNEVSSSGQDYVASSDQVELLPLPRNVGPKNKKAYNVIDRKRALRENKSVTALLNSALSNQSTSGQDHCTFTCASKRGNKKGLKSFTTLSFMPFSDLSSVKGTDAPRVVSSLPLSSAVNSSSSSSSSGKAVTKLPMKPDGLISFSLPNTPADGFEFQFSHGGMQTAWVPKDRKEELALDLIRRVGELKLEVKDWVDWANDRVLQSVSRLALEKAVIESLRKEQEKSEDCGVLNNAMLEDMQRAIDSISDEVDRADSLALELTHKISISVLEKEAAKTREQQSDTNSANILSKEKRLKSMETEVILLQEELAAEKNNLCKLLNNLGQRKDLLKKRRQERVKIDEAMKQVNIARNELERIEISARTYMSNLLVNAENEKQRLQASIKHLEQHIKVLESALASGSKPQSVAKFMGPPDSVQREPECLMCLEEDISVVFLPCRHQVVCVGCNQLHLDRGMTDCPSCRSPIEQRICARFADS